jgi:pimeloyl-ACP methyl ester carboxylesterase
MESKISRTILTAGAAAVAAAAGAVVYRRYRRDLRAAEARVFSGSRMIDTACGPIEFALAPACAKAAQAGEPADFAPTRANPARFGDPADLGTGTPVLVIHGAGGGFDQGLELGRPLIENGFRVIAPSRFGYLGTPLPEDATPAAQADAHARLLDALEVDKVAVVAFSAGAPSAMQFCLRHPGRCSALVLVVPLAYSPGAEGLAAEEPSRVKGFLLDAMLGSDFAFWTLRKLARKAMIKTILGTPPEDLEQAGAEEKARLEGFLAHIEPVSWRKKGLKNEAAIARSISRYDLERVAAPTLVIGVEDCLYGTYAGARYTAENIPGARFVSYPEGGHLAVGHTEELWREIREFLENATKTAGHPEELAATR